MKTKNKKTRLAENAEILNKASEVDLLTAIENLTVALKSFDTKLFNIIHTNDSNKTQKITFS